MKQSNQIHGFTLVELITTVTIAAILMTVAVPSFTTTIQNNRVTAQVNEFVGSLQVARSEAIKRGARVTMCKSADNNTCDTSSIGWEQGWIVFIDTNADNTHDAGETILQATGAFPSGSILVGDSASDVKNFVSYRASGVTTFASNSGEAQLILCDDRNDNSKAKAVAVAPSGRVRSMPATDSTLSCT